MALPVFLVGTRVRVVSSTLPALFGKEGLIVRYDKGYPYPFCVDLEDEDDGDRVVAFSPYELILTEEVAAPVPPRRLIAPHSVRESPFCQRGKLR